MSDTIGAVKLEHFRGLPNSKFDLSGKSFVILGSNGKGKSGLVDGIEFLFSGQVGRFVGTGTGSINHDDAVQHIQHGGVPTVSVSLTPSKAAISRKLGTDDATFCTRPNGKTYLEEHPGVSAFILRRAKILEFINDLASDRYKKFVQLLGITELDALQGAFVTAEKEGSAAAKSAIDAYKLKLAAFDDVDSKFVPKKIDDILLRISRLIAEMGLERIDDWAGASAALEKLKEKRPEANKAKIDALSTAAVVLEMLLTSTLEIELEQLAATSKLLKEVSAGTVDAPKSGIIDGGLAYLVAHPNEITCPLCELPLVGSAHDLVVRLTERSSALRELKEAQTARNNALVKVKTSLGEIIATVTRDLVHSELIASEAVDSLNFSLVNAEALLETLQNTSSDMTMPDILKSLGELRTACLLDLKVKKEALVAPDSSRLESVISLVERAIASSDSIVEAASDATRTSEVARRAKSANSAFKKSREVAIENVFTRIAGTVLSFYRKLHDCEEQHEKSECTGLELKPDSRAASGGVKLAIQFLEVPDSKDPRAFLSEGHLDSLGLCIFLATVKIFNPPGSMLVLDDVLTSIDKDHRHRVGELLLDDFHQYQVVLTTHDEYWFDLLKSLSRARGVQGRWGFTKVESWTLSAGPSLSVNKDSWDFIESNLNETSFRELGGSLRLVLEDFLKRAAVKLETKVRFKFDGKYASGDFYLAGIQDEMRKKLIAAESGEEAAIQTAIGRVFGTGDLINFLSHDNPGRLEVTFPQARDFVSGLEFLIERCKRHNLMRGQ